MSRSLKINKATQRQPKNITALFQRGLALHQRGLLSEAKKAYESVLALHSKHFDALHLLGVLCAQGNNLREAELLIRKAIEINGKNAEVYNNYGNVLLKLNLPNDAIFNFDKAIAINPAYAEAYNNRGNALQELTRYDEALKNFDHAVAINSNFAEAFFNRGNLLRILNRINQAIESFKKALQIRPAYLEAYINTGNALCDLNLFSDALFYFDQAININSDFAEAHYNRGNALRELKRLDEALVSYGITITKNPNHAEAYWNMSLALLIGGKFQKGFELYEWRWKVKDKLLASSRVFYSTLWKGGTSLENRSILLYEEQGLGDTLQFCRYVKLVADLGARVFLEVRSSLFHVLRDIAGVHQLVARGSVLPALDFHCPLLSLPLAFQTRIDTIPCSAPYLHSDKAKENQWGQFIGSHGFKVAISWQGSVGREAVGRSFPLSLFEHISKIDGLRLISLQKNEGADQLMNLPSGMKVEVLPGNFDGGDNAFEDSAAVLKCVDLLITCDTALGHLAGGLGVKTWLPLKFIPDWRWMLERSDSPWYPRHRLFRQPARGDWISVFKDIELEICNIIKSEKVGTSSKLSVEHPL